MADKPEQIQVPSSWVGAEDLPIHFANAFVGVVGPNEIFLHIGSYTPPALAGDLEEREAQVRSITYIPVKPIARIGLTPARLDELIQTLEETRKNYDNLMKSMQTEETDQ